MATSQTKAVSRSENHIKRIGEFLGSWKALTPRYWGRGVSHFEQRLSDRGAVGRPLTIGALIRYYCTKEAEHSKEGVGYSKRRNNRFSLIVRHLSTRIHN